MKNFFLGLLAALMLSAPSFAADGQAIPDSVGGGLLVANTSASVSSGVVSLDAANDAIVIDTAGHASLMLSVTGTWSGTLKVQYSNAITGTYVDGRLVTPAGVSSTSTTANGQFTSPAAGRYAKIIATALASGTVVVEPRLRTVVLSSGALPPITGDCGTVTVDTPCLNLTQTWNDAAVTFTGLKLNITNTASAAASRLLDLQVGGVSQFEVRKNGDVYGGNNGGTHPWSIRTASGGANPALHNYFGTLVVEWSESSGIIRMHMPNGGAYTWAATDTGIWRDAANTIGVRNGTIAQTFNIYNTYTDASNYERAVVGWSGSVLTVGNEAAGTGSSRITNLQGSTVRITTGGGSRWDFNASGHLLANTDNVYDIGASGATRPRRIYLAGSTSITAAGDAQIVGNIQLGSGGTVINSPADGVVQFQKTAGGGAQLTVATLPACAAGVKGARSFVTDANATTFLSTVAGGGANNVPVVCDGTNWKIG